MREDIKGIWASFSLNFFVSYLPAGTWSLMHHLHRMIDGFCECSVLQFGSQKMPNQIVRSSCMISWCLVIIFQFIQGPVTSQKVFLIRKFKKCYMQKRERCCFITVLEVLSALLALLNISQNSPFFLPQIFYITVELLCKKFIWHHNIYCRWDFLKSFLLPLASLTEHCQSYLLYKVCITYCFRSRWCKVP